MLSPSTKAYGDEASTGRFTASICPLRHMLDGGRTRCLPVIYGSGDCLAPGGHRRASNVAILLSARRVEHGIGACAQSPRGQVWGFFWRAQRSSGGILRSDEDTT